MAATLLSKRVPVYEARHERARVGWLPAPSVVAKVIVVIPTHNEHDTIAATIEAVLHQTRPPDQVYVLCDNANEAVYTAIAPYPVASLCTVKNRHKKAGNLNSALRSIVPNLNPNDVVMGFDADSVPDRDFIENAMAWHARGYGAVGATFHGRRGGGVLGLLQRCEFARFARHQHRKAATDVLSGTGWAIRAGILRRIAASRPDGMVYDVNSMVEDYRLTLDIKSLGVPAVSPADCRVTTDVMEKWKLWTSQRLRWQHGTLDELKNYGWKPFTREMWVRQVLTYLVMVATPLTVVYLAWSVALFGWQGINPLHAPLYLTGIVIVICEQAWQARKAGWRGMLSTVVVVPDFLYSVARQFVYIRSAYRVVRRRKTRWGAGMNF